MFKKVGAFGAMGAVIAVAVATTLSSTASAKVAAAASISCTSPITLGVAYPETGPAASIGTLQYNWAKQAVTKWNASNAIKFKLVQGDTQLGNGTSHAISVATAFKNNSAIVAVTGPAGSQEMQDTATIWKSAGLAPVSGSETRVQLTRAQGASPRQTTPGYFFRTVPNDGQQGANDAAYMHNVLHATHVRIIDDEEAYSTGLRDQVKADLNGFGVHVTLDHISQSDTSFSSVISAIPANTDVIFIPWQLSSQAENFYTQLHLAGKTIPMFGSDGTDDPSTFKGTGSYVSGFPYDPANSTVTSFASHHGGDAETFGIPSYTATLVNMTAVKKVCAASGPKITRAEVRAAIPKVTLSASQGLLGFSVAFLAGNQGKFQGPGDMGGKAGFGIYKIQSNGKYKRVG